MKATRDSSPAVEMFRRSLDRAVIRGCAVRLAGIVGCWAACAAVLWWAVVAVGQGLAGADLMAAAPVATRAAIALVAGLVTAVIFRDAVLDGRWPTRLEVAVETERQKASLGERLSRAVAFLDETDDTTDDGRESSADAALARGLRRLAIEQAVAALPGRLAVPCRPADITWIGAGVLAGAAALIMALVVPAPWGGAKPAQHAAEAVVAGPAAGTAGGPNDAAAADTARLAIVQRLRAAAAIERRVAAVTAALFAEAPGASRDTLPRESQARLDRLAAIQAEVCDTVRSIRPEVRGLAATSAVLAPACLEQLDGFVAAGGDRVGGHVTANRLGLAGDRAAAAADAIAAAAAALAGDTGAAAREEPIRDDPRLARAALVLDEIVAAGVPAAEDAARSPSPGATTVAAAPDLDGGPTTPAGAAAGPVRETGGSPARGDGATTSPSQAAAGQATDGAAASRPDKLVAGPSAARPTDRGWRPPAPQPLESSSTPTPIPEDAPAAYRQAVAEYYRLLRPLPVPGGAATESRPR